MARKLAPAVALISMAVSATALALGLGDIQTRSALNQSFNAEVELLSVDPAELDGVRVKLASPEAFQRAGVDRPFFLSGLKFTPMLNAEGRTVIRVTSQDPIREPFLNFLVEVNWPKGKLVREYTVLLDPPTTLARRPGQVERAETAAPAPSYRPAARPAAPSTPTVLPDQYGPVQENETLWGISRRLRPDGASLAQTLMALYKANPEAFVRGDINRLQQGRILRVPARDEIFALSRREAQAAYAAAQETSLASRTQAPAQADQQPGVAGESGGAGMPGADAAELRIATPRPEGAGEAGAGDDTATGGTADDLKNALLIAREDAETSRQAAENLRGEVDSLEQQLADMQRLLSLKDEQLARLQTAGEEAAAEGEIAAVPDEAAPMDAETAAAEQAVSEGEQVAAEDAAPADEPVTDEAQMPAEQAPIEAAADGEPAAEPMPAEMAGMEVPADAESQPEPAVAVEPAEPVEAVEPAEPVEPEPVAEAAPEPQPEPMPRREKGVLDMLGDNAALVGIGGAVIVALLGLMALLRRRGKQQDKAEENLDESILMEPSEGDHFDAAAEEAAAAGSDTSLLSEFSQSEMHSLDEDTSEVDPVSEADVYIAYGRYDQAEGLLNQALAKEPQRLALKFKLLDVYYANRNVAAFTACAQELADAGQDGVDASAWQRVCDMGRELAPEYPLFTEAPSQLQDESLPDFEPSQPASIEPLSELGDESILEIPGADEGKGRVDAMSEPTGETEMDLTLDLDDLSMPQSVSQDDESLEGLESIDLELPDLDRDPTKQQAAEETSDDSLILDLETGLSEALEERAEGDELDAESLQAQLDELSDLTDLDDELSQLTADFDGAAPMAEEPESLPMEEAAPAGEAEIPPPFDSELAEADEVQTKLDLAIAYVEMGDKEGARSILDEVRNEGSDEQKAQAEKLLADIGG